MTYDFTASVEFPQEAIEWIATWHCYLDACPKCQNLNGYPFYGTGNLPDFLMHPQYGPVWDIGNDQSMTHPNCRCSVEAQVRVYWDKVPFIHEFTQEVNMPPLQVEMITDVTQLREIRDEITEIGASYRDLRTVETLVMRLLRMVEDLSGGDPNIKKAVDALQELLMTIRMLQIAYMALTSARLAAGDPFAWLSVISAGMFIANDISQPVW